MIGRLLTVAACSLLCMAGMARAADMDVEPVSPTYRPVAYAKAYDWTGLYLGINGGWAFGQHSSTSNFASGNFDGSIVNVSANQSGGLLGAQLGFNWQVSWFVFGGEVDGMWSIGQQVTTSVACAAGCLTAVENSNVKAIWTSRLRFGAAFDRILVYATGGMAFVSASETLTVTNATLTATLVPFSHSKTGWTAGAGIEGAFWDHWSARLEYLYVDAKGSNNTTTLLTAVFGTSAQVVETARYQEHVVRAAISYRFGP
jgi:outer membrane immunogenic protein